MRFSKGEAAMPAAALVFAFVLVIAGSAEGLASNEGEIYFTILHTNDEHSCLIPHSPAIDYHPGTQDPTVGGAARLGAAIENIREQSGEPVLVMSGGDFLGGAPYSWLALQGQAVELEIMQQMGYDFAVLGNHEFDYGPDVLAKYLAAAGYPEAASSLVLLAANMSPGADHPLADMGIASTHIHQMEAVGLSVGIFGLMGDHAQTVVADKGGVKFADPIETAQQSVDELQDENVDLVVAITHSGLDEDVEMARKVSGIDLIVGGHCHTPLSEPVVEGDTIIVQAGSLIEYLGYLKLAYEPETGKLRVRNEEEDTPLLIPVDSSVGEDPSIAQSVKQATSQLNSVLGEVTDGRYTDIYHPVATSDFTVADDPPKAETPMGNLVTDALRSAVEEVSGREVDFAFQASGQIRGPLVPGETAENCGKISVYEVLQQTGLGQGEDGYPGYAVVSLYLTAEDIWRVMETSALLGQLMGDSFFIQVSGLRTQIDPERAILLQVPVLDVPVPTYRAVRAIERESGGATEDHVPLGRDDDRLFHVVTDYYVAEFVPMVGEMLPRLSIEPKDAAGNPIDDLSTAIVYRKDDGNELKVWEAVLRYLQAKESVPQRYDSPQGRIRQVTAVPPLMSWVIVPLLVIALLVVVLLYRRRTLRQ